MKDLLSEASAIAELRDMDLILAWLKDVTTWRPEHEGACQHCQASLEAHLQQVYQQHELDPRWVAPRVRALLAGMSD